VPVQLRISSAVPRAAELQIEFESPTDQSLTPSESPNTNDARSSVGNSLSAPTGIASLKAPNAHVPLTHTVSSAETPIRLDEVASLQGTGEASASNTTTQVASSTTPDSSATAERLSAAASKTPRIDLGLDGRMFGWAPATGPTKQSKRRQDRAALERSLNASLRASLAEADVQQGYARGNVFAATLSSAVRTAGPPEGNAVIQVTVNSLGEVSELHLLRGSSGDWSRALKSFREQAKLKRVQLPAGSQGLRVTLNVSTKMQLPSGKKVDASAVGVKRPSLSANGLTFHGEFDVADLSGKTSQVVHAKVVQEEVL